MIISQVVLDPSAIGPKVIDEYEHCYSRPGFRITLEYYRTYETDAEYNREHAERLLERPALTLGGERRFGDDAVAMDIRGEVIERCGH